MKALLRLLVLVVLFPGPARAADELPLARPASPSDVLAAVAAADDARVSASQAGDRARLEAVLSDDLYYGHSNAKVDTKAALIDAFVSRRSVYEGFEYKERVFTPVAAGVVLMTGRVVLHVRNGEQRTALDLNFLAVWREEHGRWRLRAWQSCKQP